MSKYRFLFDLDATITKKEILPQIAAEIGCLDQMKDITERTMTGEIPFEHSFIERVNILKQIPVSRVREIVTEIPVNEQLVAFLKENRHHCYVVTGNLDVWICDLMERIGMTGQVYCSHGIVDGDRLTGIAQIMDKSVVVQKIPTPLVAVGDGNNDAEMIAAAEVGIGFGGVRPIAPALMRNATHAVYTEEKLCQFLKRL